MVYWQASQVCIEIHWMVGCVIAFQLQNYKYAIMIRKHAIHGQKRSRLLGKKLDLRGVT